MMGVEEGTDYLDIWILNSNIIHSNLYLPYLCQEEPNNPVNRIIPYNDLLINTVFEVKNKIW